MSLATLGFAPSEAGVCCGYDRFDNRRIFLRTMIHELTHLFWWETFKVNLPSWLAEGMATYFESMTRREGRWRFGELNENRLTFLKKALAGKRQFSLAELMRTDAVKLLQLDGPRTLDFYAQCWGVFFYCRRTPALQQKFAAFLQQWARGQRVDLAKALGMSAQALDAAMVDFWRTL